MRRTISLVGRGTLAAVAVLAGQAAYAVRRQLPSFEGGDPSGSFGDPTLPRLRMAVLGDSTVTGPGLNDPHESFVAQIAVLLSDRYHVELTSFAVGGAQSAEVLGHQVPMAIESEWDLTVVSVGSNDVLHATPVRVFERNLEAITAAMKGVSGSVVLMGVGDIGTVPRFPRPLDRLATLTGRIANGVHTRVAERQDVGRADHWGWSAQAFRQPGMFAPDLFHPSAAGHRVWADTVLPEVERVLREASVHPRM